MNRRHHHVVVHNGNDAPENRNGRYHRLAHQHEDLISKGKIHNNQNSWHHNGHQSHWKALNASMFSKRQWMIVIGGFSILVLVSIHLYLLSVAIGQPQYDNGDRHNTHDSTDSESRQHIRKKTIDSSSKMNALPTNVSTSALQKDRIWNWTSYKDFHLSPLQPMDYEQYTIRMNTWNRPNQLLASVIHHGSCPGVNQIQIVWCDQENEPPSELFDPTTNPHASKVIIERHAVNTLNERFHILTATPTIGILSIDDDVLRPCHAIDSGFFKWIKSPHRMVGFDARIHIERDNKWSYGYLSTTKEENTYSMSLTRYCFIHRDYMNIYMNKLPHRILNMVSQNLNCEDIAMSFMISALTNGQTPLLADTWAMNTMLKLQLPDGSSISGTKNHKHIRDECVDIFATLLGLKNDKHSHRLQFSRWIHQHDSYFDCGANEDEYKNDKYVKSQRELEYDHTIQEWHNMKKSELKKEITQLMSEAGYDAYKNGLLTIKT